MAALCQLMGLDVGHERVGKDGCSSFQFAVNTKRVIFHSAEGHKGREHYEFDRIIHVVRHPLDVIASTAFTDMNGAIEWQSGFVPVMLHEGKVRQAIQTWLGWNELIEMQTQERIRVEDADTELPRLLACEPPQDTPPKDYNGRQHDSLSWARVAMACNSTEFLRLQNMAQRYGYET